MYSYRLTHLKELEAESILCAFQKELTQAALLTAGKDHDGIRIKTFGGNHRPEAIEISVDVGCDYFHGEPRNAERLRLEA